ncbi:MAG: hypothetical protein ACLFSA_08905, partial [Spirochaetaceae bacterium]
FYVSGDQNARSNHKDRTQGDTPKTPQPEGPGSPESQSTEKPRRPEKPQEKPESKARLDSVLRRLGSHIEDSG